MYYSWLSTGGVDNSKYLRIGNGSGTGIGIAFNDLIPVTTGSYACSWSGKSLDTTTKYIFCLRLFDVNSTDITQQITPPAGWFYSATSKAHTVYGMSNQQPDTWEPFNYVYTLQDNTVRYLTLSLRYWTGGDAYLNIDNLAIQKVGGTQWIPDILIPASLTTTGINQQYSMYTVLASRELAVQLTYQACSSYVKIDHDLTDLRTIKTPRMFRLNFILPINTLNLNWEDDIYRSRPILSHDSVYENTINANDLKVSTYPFNSINNTSTGITMAVPMNPPTYQYCSYQLDRGFKSEMMVATSPSSTQPYYGKVHWSIYLYKTDAPAWGFRSAAKKYYQLFPGYFIRNNLEEGCWFYGVQPTNVPAPLDFGAKFYETSSVSSTLLSFCQNTGIEIYYYLEPWGVWQNVGFVTTKPPYEDRVQTLTNWATDTLSSALLMRAPRWYTAQAILNSSYQNVSGRFYIDDNSYYWHQWSGSSAWNQHWPSNPSLNIPGPNTGTLYKNYYIDYKINDKSGDYIDSIAATGGFGNVKDFTASHLSANQYPLTLSLNEGRPMTTSQLAQSEFLEWLNAYHHARGKKVMGNIFPTAYRFYAHQLDILGSEIFDVTESETYAAMRRTMSYQKTNTNLLQWWETNYLTNEEIQSYVKNQLFYGFFPGISAAGGGLNFGLPDRYFNHPEMYERDRPLFQTYIPLIKSISHAGWEPVTYAACSNAQIRLERFGVWSTGAIYLNVKNISTTQQTATLQIQADKLNITESLRSLLRIQSLPEQLTIPNTYSAVNQTISFSITLENRGITTLQIRPPATVHVDAAQWEFLE